MMWMQGGDFSWWWMLMGLLWMVVFWGGLVALAVWGIRALAGPARDRHSSPLDIARERYARGDISREQYEEIRGAIAS